MVLVLDSKYVQILVVPLSTTPPFSSEPTVFASGCNCLDSRNSQPFSIGSNDDESSHNKKDTKFKYFLILAPVALQ
jgi:hypothetical protein